MLPLKTLGKEQKSIKKGFSLIRTINLEKKKIKKKRKIVFEQKYPAIQAESELGS